MSRRTIFTVLASLVTLLFIASAQAAEPENLRLVHVKPHERAEKLHPSLKATLDAGGVLKGHDNLRRPIIDLPAGNEKKLEDSKVVKSVDTKIPDQWDALGLLVLSYSNSRPTDQELKDMGLELVNDYKRGSFLIVKLAKDKQVDAKLIKNLEDCKSILRVTPSFTVRAATKKSSKQAGQ